MKKYLMNKMTHVLLNSNHKNFTGIDAPFEKPENPQIELKTGEQTIAESMGVALEYIIPRVSY